MKRGIVLLVIILSLALAYASTFSDTVSSDFSQGVYNNTLHNGSSIILSGTNLSGEYTSRIFDALGISRLDNLSYFSSISAKEYLYSIDANADVWNSTNFGVSWNLVKDDYSEADANGAQVSFFNSTQAYFVLYNQKIYFSLDNGLSWTKINDNYNGAEGQNIDVGIINKNNDIYLIEGDQDVWKSSDSGASFTKTSSNFNGASGVARGLVVNSSNTLISVDASADVWKSDDGITWTKINDDYNGADGNSATAMTIDSSNNLYILDSPAVWKSSDSGASFTKTSSDFDTSDAHVGISMTSDSSSNIYIIDGGEDVYSSSNGVSWTKLASNFNAGNGNAIAFSSILKTTNLSIQIKNCSQPDCSDSSWQPVNSSNINLQGRYFQYKFYFSTQDASISPLLFNISLNYAVLDNIAPSISFISPLNANYTSSSILINISASDNSGINKIWWYNGTSNLSYNSESYYDFKQGLSSILAYANDSFGNLNYSAVSFYIDSLAPSILIDYPQNQASYGYNSSLSLNFSASDVNLANCWYNLNSGENFSIPSCQNITFNVSGNGDYTIYVYANDSFNNLGYNSRNFTINLGAPTITLLSPVDSYLNYNNITFAYIPQDIDLQACELWADFNSIFSLNQSSFPVNAVENYFYLNLTDGVYLWNIKCNDSQNHFSFNGNKTFYVDTIKPNISLSEPQGSKTSLSNIPLIFSVTDNSPVSCKYNIEWSTGGIVIANTTNNCSSAYFNLATIGNYVLNLYANDSAGNSNYLSSSFSVTTQSAPQTPSSSGGGGGGGFTTNVSTAKAEFNGLSDMVVNPGEFKKISVSIKNSGSKFLNNCRLKGSGIYSSWISESQAKGLSSGEISDFIITLTIPRNISGKYQLEAALSCEEASIKKSFIAEIIEKKIKISIIKSSRSKNQLKILYSLSEQTGIAQEVKIALSLLDNKDKIAESVQSLSLEADSDKEIESIMEIPDSLAGNYNLIISLNSDSYSTFVQENVLIGKPSISGFSIFGTDTANSIIIIVLILVFLVFAVLIIIKIIKAKRKAEITRRNYHHHLNKALESIKHKGVKIVK